LRSITFGSSASIKASKPTPLSPVKADAARICSIGPQNPPSTSARGFLSRILPMKIKPSSSPPSPSPIAAFAQRRSSFAQLREVSAFHELGRPYSEHPHSFGPSPSALVGQLRSSPEPTRTAFERRFLSYMPCRKLRAQRRFGEVRWLDDPAPSSTTEPLPLDWTLSSPLGGGLYQASWRL